MSDFRFILIFIHTTQLYSNLVTYMKSTTYLCLVLVVLVSPKISRVRLASLYTASLCVFLSASFSTQLSKHSPFIDLRRQRRTNAWSLKQRVGSAQWKQAFPVLPSLVKMQVGRGNI